MTAPDDRDARAARDGDAGPAAEPQATQLRSVADLMAYAYAMEAEAAERYAEFADVMDAHNNPEVAELFRKMARIEHLHARQLRDAIGGAAAPRPADGRFHWDDAEAPETGDHAELHYLMTPHHALQIARRNEERARRFYDRLAAAASDADVRDVAAQLRDDEAAHVRLMDEWLARTPAPEAGWSLDLDPPNYPD